MDELNSINLSRLLRYSGRIPEDEPGVGTCHDCRKSGPTGKICLHCAYCDGVSIGDCNACCQSGPIWENCDWCDDGMFVSVHFGKCESCDVTMGPVGSRCDECHEGNFVVADNWIINQVAERRSRFGRQVRPDGYTCVHPTHPVCYTDRFLKGIFLSPYPDGYPSRIWPDVDEWEEEEEDNNQE